MSLHPAEQPWTRIAAPELLLREARGRLESATEKANQLQRKNDELKRAGEAATASDTELARRVKTLERERNELHTQHASMREGQLMAGDVYESACTLLTQLFHFY